MFSSNCFQKKVISVMVFVVKLLLSRKDVFTSDLDLLSKQLLKSKFSFCPSFLFKITNDFYSKIALVSDELKETTFL